MTPEELPAYLDALALKAGVRGGRAAADGMVQAFDRGIKTDELVRTSGHPSAPGSPPALETGRLRASFIPRRAIPVGNFRWESQDHPNTVYARIQEYGGHIYAKHTFVDRHGRVQPGFLRWEGPGGVHYARHVHLPARPYMRPAVHRMAGDGTLHKAAVASFLHEMGWA